MTRKRRINIAFCLAGAFLFSSLAFAQAPGSVNVGAIEKKMRDDTKAAAKEKKILQKQPEPAVEDKRPQEGVTEAKTEACVVISKFVLNGVTIFKPADFSDILSEYKDRCLGVKEFSEIAYKIQRFYRAKGYITSLVYIPVQKIADNTLEIRVVEGYIGAIDVEGGKYFDKEFVRKKFGVREGDTVLYNDLLRDMRRLNTNPDRTVKAVLVPGEQKESTDIVLKVEDQRPFHVFTEFHNRGTKYTGKNRFTLGVADNNLFGLDDMLTVRFQKSNEKLIGGSIDYNIPVNYLGTRAGGYYSYVDVDLVREFEVLEAKGKAYTAGAYVVHPLIDEEHLRGNLGAGLDVKNNSNYLLGIPTSKDDLTVVKFNFNLDNDDPYGASFFGSELDFGIPDFLGSLGKDDTDASRLGSGGQFFKHTIQLMRRQNLPWSSFLLLSGRAQYTPDKLVAGEQFYIGGADTVRGYPELEYMSDYGYLLNMEVRTPVFLLPKDLKLADKLQMVYFLDFGQGYLRNAMVGEKKRESLLGAGWGIRFNPWKGCYFRLDWGFPVDPKPSDGSESTVHLWAHVDLF